MDWNEMKALKVGDLVRYAIQDEVETIEIVTKVWTSEADAHDSWVGGVVMLTTIAVLFDRIGISEVGDEGGISEANSHYFEKLA